MTQVGHSGRPASRKSLTQRSSSAGTLILSRILSLTSTIENAGSSASSSPGRGASLQDAETDDNGLRYAAEDNAEHQWNNQAVLMARPIVLAVCTPIPPIGKRPLRLY